MVMVWSWLWATLEGILYLLKRYRNPKHRLLTDHVHDRTVLGWLTMAYAVSLAYHLLVALGLIRFDGLGRGRTRAAIPDRSTARTGHPESASFSPRAK